MIVFPNCKINLGLHITAKRDDGYHNLETVFYPLPFYDVLEIISKPGQENITFTSSGLAIEGDTGNNLCVKAWQLLKKDFPQMPAIEAQLHKAIPMGAGLGGGSADGAFTLQLLNKLFGLGLSAGQLTVYALQLGSDCPFFILNTPCFATGRGEKLEPVSLDLSGYVIVLVNPGIHVSTRDAFSHIRPAIPAISARDIIQQPITTWRNELSNDFEKPVFALYPEIAKVKEELYRAGAVYAAMSGSGSTVYGIFEKEEIALTFPYHYFVKRIVGSS